MVNRLHDIRLNWPIYLFLGFAALMAFLAVVVAISLSWKLLVWCWA